MTRRGVTRRGVQAADERDAAEARNRDFIRACAVGDWIKARALADADIGPADARVTHAWGYRRALCREVLTLLFASGTGQAAVSRRSTVPPDV